MNGPFAQGLLEVQRHDEGGGEVGWLAGRLTGWLDSLLEWDYFDPAKATLNGEEGDKGVWRIGRGGEDMLRAGGCVRQGNRREYRGV